MERPGYESFCSSSSQFATTVSTRHDRQILYCVLDNHNLWAKGLNTGHADYSSELALDHWAVDRGRNAPPVWQSVGQQRARLEEREFEWSRVLIGCSASREWPLEPFRAVEWHDEEQTVALAVLLARLGPGKPPLAPKVKRKETAPLATERATATRRNQGPWFAPAITLPHRTAWHFFFRTDCCHFDADRHQYFPIPS